MVVSSERGKEIFKCIVDAYMMTGEPVGSRYVSKKSHLSLSPATIRNEMADLEERGYLQQPHTSAGRLPTEKGLRVYIEDLLKPQEPTTREKQGIVDTCRGCKTDTCELMRGVCRTLSSFSGHTAIAIPPPLCESIVTYVEFIKFRPRQVIAIFVTSSGIVQNRIVDMREELGDAELDHMNRYLAALITGLPLREVRRRVAEEMATDSRRYHDLLRRVLVEEGDEFVEDERDLYVEGQTQLLNELHIGDVRRMRELLQALEEKKLLLTILDRSMKTGGVRVIFGSECHLDAMQGCSIITATYGYPGPFSGLIGVIGPMRMDYARLIPMVDFTAKIVTETLSADWHTQG